MSNLSFQGFFFDTDKVMNAVSAFNRQWMNKVGGYVRATAKNSIRYPIFPGETSQPNSPPIAHRFGSFMRDVKKNGRTTRQASSPLKEMIFYGYDPRSESVVVGPALFRNARVPGLAPKLLEKGGKGTFATDDGKIKTGHWKPRPFIGPALKKSAPKFPDFIRTSGSYFIPGGAR